MAIKLLMMDFYGTLVREDDGVTREICRDICEASPLNIVPGDVARVWWDLMNDAYLACQNDRFIKLIDIQNALLEELCEQFESRALPEELLGKILTSWKQPEPYDDLRAFLSKLPLQLCIVSNGDTDILAQAFRHTQLKIDHFVSSEAALCYKPNPGILFHAMRQMDVDPAEVLFVGDSLTYDIKPAGQVGMHTAWINRNGRSRGDVSVDINVNTLVKLKNLIR